MNTKVVALNSKTKSMEGCRTVYSRFSVEGQATTCLFSPFLLSWEVLYDKGVCIG